MSKMFNYEADHIHDMVHPDLLTDTTHYVAECKEIILNEVSPNYPKLTEYEKEWMYFSEHVYQDGHPVNLEYQTVNIDGQASVENAIPFYYKEASLKGNTLVNKASIVERVIANDGWNHLRIRLNYPISINSKYLINIFNLPSDMRYVLSDTTNVNLIMPFYANKKTIFVPQYKSEDIIILHVNNPSTYRPLTQEEINKIQVIIIDYQDGMENWDIPYFEGMKSVQMPVLTTTGKNLFAPKYKNPDNYTYLGVYYSMPIDLIEGKEYKMSFNVDCDITGCYFSLSSTPQPVDIGSVYLHVISNGAIDESSYVASKTNYICFYKDNCGDMFSALSNLLLSLNNVQLEEGSVATPYEPHKSNILTTNEEVELRGNGEVQDDLNLLTGELTQRIGEVVLDGVDMVMTPDTSNGDYVRFNLSYYNGKIISDHDMKVQANLKCDKLPVLTDDSHSQECIHNGSSATYKLMIWLHSSKLNTLDNAGICQYLQSNPITVQYEISTESIKTVDLSTIIRPYEGTNHYTLSSETIPPQLNLSIPVESTGAQTLNEINQEE